MKLDQTRSTVTPAALSRRYTSVRATTQALAEPLSEADCQVQSMPDASPTRWHLAHVTWFFETFVLERFESRFKPHHEAFRVLFNSYYNGVGEAYPRARRGLLTRPSLGEVQAYRQAVDERMQALLGSTAADEPELGRLVELGLQHEQQHQELILTDIKHLLSCNPLQPVYRAAQPAPGRDPGPLRFLPQEPRLVDTGHAGDDFAFDNETPRHRSWLESHAVGDRLITQGEWAEFIAAGGYRQARWWLSAGWDWVRAQQISAPLYWQGSEAEGWHDFTLHGQVPIDPHAPVTHVSLYEADAYARWRGERDGLPLRLPTETEWEAIAAPASGSAAAGNFLDNGFMHPRSASLDNPTATARQLFGDVWEWTASAYQAYPGYRPWTGATGEYNGKFMVNQYVLRGGSCVTPASHIRVSYRNFFPAEARWQFNGVRLAMDAD